MQIERLVSLSNLTTWRVGGSAECLAEPKDLKEVKSLIAWANRKTIPINLIGAGSNLLISDKGLKGLSLCMRKLHGITLDPQDGLIEVFAGEPIPNLSRKAAKAGLSGLEWAIGIPGTIGGACVMNAGAQGGCMADWIESVEVMPIDSKKKSFVLTKHQMDFGYRSSRLQKEKLVVLSVKLRLKAGNNSKQLTQKTNDNLIHRITTQPYQEASCGSVFRNPEPLKAGHLIEKLGLKGHRIGGAEISKIHANFIINKGDASASDICKLIRFIQLKVKKTYGVTLDQEIKTLGFE